MSQPLRIDAADDLVSVAFKVCTALDEVGIRAVLTGGSAATYYAPEAYQSRDADWIASWYSKEREFAETLRLLGFEKRGRIYVHPHNVITLDFPDEEIRVGQSFVREFDSVRRGDLVLHVLRAVHSVCDRLASYYWYQDVSALKAAVAVAVRQKVDLNDVALWSREHGEFERFLVFRDRVLAARAE